MPIIYNLLTCTRCTWKKIYIVRHAKPKHVLKLIVNVDGEMATETYVICINIKIQIH